MPPKGAKRAKRGGKAEEPEQLAGSSADQAVATSGSNVQPLTLSSAPLVVPSTVLNDSLAADVVCVLFSSFHNCSHHFICSLSL